MWRDNKYKRHIKALERRIEGLMDRLGTVYWNAHTDGRIYGNKPLTREEIKRATDVITGLDLWYESDEVIDEGW